MQNWQGKIVWITGASSGIGEELAQQLNRAGATVILSARREETLRELAGRLSYPANSLVLPLDMERQEEFPAKLQLVLDRYGRIDLLFNNAGISQRSYAADTDFAVDRRLMEINYFGTVALTKELLPQFRKQQGGHIAVTSSLAGKFGFYQRTAYAASKFALHGFFESLRLEEEEHQLKVTLLCPSGIKTAISQNALSGSGEKFGKSSALQEEGMAVEECVKRMIAAVENEKKEVIIGQGMEPLSVKIKALFPDFFLKMLRKKKPETNRKDPHKMSKKIISGIQQIGIGNRGVHPLWKWYRQNFGMDIGIFEEAAEAPLMTKYTGGEVHSRNAALAINMQGGGGFEIWQFTSRESQAPQFEPALGDYGIYIAKMKSRNVAKAYKEFKKRKLNLLTELVQDPNGNEHFYLKDPNGNIFEVVEGSSWFSENEHLTGGAYGAVIGVSDMDAALKLYRDVLEHDQVLYDDSGVFDDFKGIMGGDGKFRRVLLQNSKSRQGAFGPLLGNSQIELVQKLEGEGRKIFKDRYWGDMGYIHLCFDVRNMESLKKECEKAGFPFTIDSDNSFDMGQAAGRFAYIEDPDGAWIEFVETHKVPIMEKWNWYLNIKNRKPEKPLPRWMLKALRFNKIKD